MSDPLKRNPQWPPQTPPPVPAVPVSSANAEAGPLAVASVVGASFGLLLGVFGLPFGVAAVIFGFVARRKAVRSRQPTGLATAGIVVGFLSVGFGVLSGGLLALMLVLGATSEQQVSAAGAAASAQVADANAWYDTNGTYDGWDPPATVRVDGMSLTVSDVRSGDFVCVETARGAVVVHALAASGEALAAGPRQPGAGSQMWAAGGCPPLPGRVP